MSYVKNVKKKKKKTYIYILNWILKSIIRISSLFGSLLCQHFVLITVFSFKEMQIRFLAFN